MKKSDDKISKLFALKINVAAAIRKQKIISTNWFHVLAYYYCYFCFRQVRDSVAWVFSEPMLHYYIQLFTKSWWPNGHIVSSTVVRTDEEKLKTRGEARRQFLNNLPEVLANLVGAQSAQRGATKVFDTLQNVNLNKQLFYVSRNLFNSININKIQHININHIIYIMCIIFRWKNYSSYNIITGYLWGVDVRSISGTAAQIGSFWRFREEDDL